MNDSLRWQAAIAEADNALDLLRVPPAADALTRRKQMARAAKRLNKAAEILWDCDGS